MGPAKKGEVEDLRNSPGWVLKPAQARKAR
jgi:hypothetical protein